MGLFSIDIEVAKPGNNPQWSNMGTVIVDSGSELTWLPEADLRRLRIDVFRKDQVFIMANGQQVTRDVGIALIRSGEFKTVDEVVFAKKDDLCLIAPARSRASTRSSARERRNSSLEARFPPPPTSDTAIQGSLRSSE